MSKIKTLLKQIGVVVWELSKSYRKKMKVPVRIMATEKLLEGLDDRAIGQAVNIASLPGIIGASLMMPDAHYGYGFPVGGVAAFDLKEGVICPGGIGFDINCGVRLLTSNLTEQEVLPRIEKLINELFKVVPSGVGATGVIRLSEVELKEVMIKGAKWAIEKGLGQEGDLENIEEKGSITNADPEVVSKRAIKRGLDQLGTLGAGNHYLEVQKVKRVFDRKVGERMGVASEGQVCVMIHCGSRGLGHQIASDYLRIFDSAMKKYKINVSDRQLACAPINSLEGKRYFGAMAAAANFAFCNRQVITHKVRQVFSKVFGKSTRELGLELLYDVAHNIAKIEKHQTPNSKTQTKEVVVHRKGATRAFPGQPVIIGGSMETGSYLLVGTKGAMKKTFSSTAHGSGRTMSRNQAKKIVQGRKLWEKMRARGIYVKSASYSGLAEEAGLAYKDINEVVKAVSLADISQPVASFTPLGNIKG
jgi:tRNA-splicing ligase RtcB